MFFSICFYLNIQNVLVFRMNKYSVGIYKVIHCHLYMIIITWSSHGVLLHYRLWGFLLSASCALGVVGSPHLRRVINVVITAASQVVEVRGSRDRNNGRCWSLLLWMNLRVKGLRGGSTLGPTMISQFKLHVKSRNALSRQPLNTLEGNLLKSKLNSSDGMQDNFISCLKFFYRSCWKSVCSKPIQAWCLQIRNYGQKMDIVIP